jgi:hypothetical protein
VITSASKPASGPGLERRHDAWLAVTVRRDHALGQAGDLHHRAQLGHGELLVHGMIDLGEHSARRADLDYAGVLAQLLPDRAHAVVHAVGQAQLAAVPGQVRKLIHPGQRVGMQIAVPAGGAEDRTGSVDRRAVEQPLGDRPGQVDASPPTSRTEVTPASSAARRSLADLAARSATGSSGSCPRSNVREPRKCPWQSHIPGMTAAAWVVAAPGVSGAPAAGPA